MCTARPFDLFITSLTPTLCIFSHYISLIHTLRHFLSLRRQPHRHRHSPYIHGRHSEKQNPSRRCRSPAAKQIAKPCSVITPDQPHRRLERRDSPSVTGRFVTAASTTAASSEKRGAQTESAAAAETADRGDGKDGFQKVAAPRRSVLLRGYFGGSSILLI